MINYRVTSKLSAAALFLLSLVFWSATSSAFDSLQHRPYVIVTSDLHISAPDGRLREQTKYVETFFAAVGEMQPRPEAVFVVGDVVDNAVERNGRIQYGDRQHFHDEASIFRRMVAKLAPIPVITALGPGHDFGGEISLTIAENQIGLRRGEWKWNQISFIWLTVPRDSFADSVSSYMQALDNEEYRWLEERLRDAEKAVLLFHVPLRTDATFQLGKWSGERNLTIDPRERIYQVIGKYSAKIAAIFCGHIHQSVQSDWNGIPIYIAPLIGGYYATVQLLPVVDRLDVRLNRVDSLIGAVVPVR